MRNLILIVLLFHFPFFVSAQEKGKPIIDMHQHTSSLVGDIPATLPCSPKPCQGRKTAIQDRNEILPMTIQEMKKNNVVLGIVTGNNLNELNRWKDTVPEMFMTGYQFWNPLQPNIEQVKKEFIDGRLDIMGEIGTQYNGFAPNDPRLDIFYALAEELDVPVLIHCGGMASPNKRFNLKDGNPLLMEEVLKKHPKLRIYIENASYPYAQEIIALMSRYSNVYADLSTVTWIKPRKAFHNYLEKLIDAGFGKRLMFGSDQMMWPETIPMAIEAVESAEFLTEDQKRDIFYNNAARFLRLDEETIAKHHEK